MKRSTTHCIQLTPEPPCLVLWPLKSQQCLKGRQPPSSSPTCLFGLEFQQEGQRSNKPCDSRHSHPGSQSQDVLWQRAQDTCRDPYVQKPRGASPGPLDPEADSHQNHLRSQLQWSTTGQTQLIWRVQKWAKTQEEKL